MTGTIVRRLRGIALCAAMVLGCASAALAQDKTGIDAFAVWRGQGSMVKTGEQIATLIGVLEGPVFVETTEGPVPAGTIVCPATMEVRIDDRSQKGSGHCTFFAEDGAEVYGSWTCAGLHLVGCRGTFTLTGGSGRLKGAAGSGPILIRSNFVRLSPDRLANAIGETGGGIMVWKGLEVRVP